MSFLFITILKYAVFSVSIGIIMNIKISKTDECTVDIGERFDGDIEYYDISIKYNEKTVPRPISFSFERDEKNVFSVFSSDARTKRHPRPSWEANTNKSRLAFNMPLLAAIKRDGMNAFTLSLSDAKVPAELKLGISEHNGFASVTLKLFPQPITATESFNVTLRIDKSNLRYEKAIGDVIRWWETECGYTPAYVPEHATLPMNSAWYSYHQNIDVDDIVDECKRSKALGMETIILDDGWQTDDVSLGYAYCGDWNVATKKIPSMKDFVDRVHAVGMKFMLWFSVPYVGINSNAFTRFRDMLLDYSEDKKWFCLDPRFPEVRKYLVNTYKNAITEYGLDGLKLDFIDSFKLTSTSIAPDDRRDTESLEDALEILLSEIYSALTDINPDVLIEFRQSYVGPTVRKYGNMLRVFDCPEDALCNRYSIADLRLTSGKTAVHSDMLLWRSNIDAEDAATALVSVLYGVAQISVKLKNLPESHLKMLAFYLDFMKKNRDVLLFGDFTAENPETLYSKASASKNGETITTLYTATVDNIPADFVKYTVVNGTTSENIILDCERNIECEIVNCLGDTVAKTTLQSGISKINIPKNGMAICLLKKQFIG